MPVPLVPLAVVAPGFYGLNKQQSSGVLPPEWATEADNCVVDGSGRVAARKGWAAVTTSPISGTPDVEQIFEYLNASGTSEFVSAANSKLYSGTTTLTEKTGSLTITDDNWKFQNFNGNVIGVQDSHEPIIYNGSGNFTLLQQNITSWAATTAYSVGDVVKSTAGATTVYFYCTTAGTSGGTEPTWDETVGNTTTDGTVTWTCAAFPAGNEALTAFGRLWVVDATATVIHYSDLLIPQNFSGGSAGSIDLKSVWVYGMDEIVALHEYNGYLLIFGKRSIVIYSGASDPSTMAISEQLHGIGCIARDSVQPVDADLWWLSDTGVRSFRRTIQEKSMPTGDISANNKDFLRSYYASEDKDIIRSVYHEAENFYLVTMPTSGVTFCFDTKAKLQDGTARTTVWNTINPKALCSGRDGNLYMGQAGVVAKYVDYNDNTASYIWKYSSVWNDFGNQIGPRIKIPKKMRALFLGGRGYGVTLTLGYDYEDDSYSDLKYIPDATVAEFNVAEFNEDEFSGQVNFNDIKFFPGQQGTVLKYGLSATIDGVPLSLQRIDIQAKTGRFN